MDHPALTGCQIQRAKATNDLPTNIGSNKGQHLTPEQQGYKGHQKHLYCLVKLRNDIIGPLPRYSEICKSIKHKI